MQHLKWFLIVASACGAVPAGCVPNELPAKLRTKPPAKPPAKLPAEPPAQRLEGKVEKPGGLKYLLYLPAGHGRAKKRWPLMLFLHGAGERGANLKLVRRHGPPKLIAAGREFPFIVVSPQCPRGQWWSPGLLKPLLDEMEAKYAVDLDRVYVTGLSMGGFGTWALAIDQPHRFAAIAPICGMGDPGKAARIKHLPAWVFHGAKDPVVPIKGGRKFRGGPGTRTASLRGSQDMVEALRAAGGKPKFTVYPNAGHDSWTKTYANEQLYAWLLRQRRKK